MKILKRVLLYMVALAWDIPAWTFTLLLCLLCWKMPRFQSGCLVCELRETWMTRWWLKKWNGAAIGHAVIFKPDGMGTKEIDTVLEYHEHTHVEQYEGAMLNAAIYSAVLWLAGGNYIVALCAWGCGGVLHVLSNSVVAVLRNEEFYRGGSHEEAARAQAKMSMDND